MDELVSRHSKTDTLRQASVGLTEVDCGMLVFPGRITSMSRMCTCSFLPVIYVMYKLVSWVPRA